MKCMHVTSRKISPHAQPSRWHAFRATSALKSTWLRSPRNHDCFVETSGRAQRQSSMTLDTKIGGRSGQFPATRWSAILAARSKDPAEKSRALEVIVSAYWKPIYKYLRLRWGKPNEEAKDLTQEFFARLIEKDYLSDFNPAKARLRTFLRVCADRFLANGFKAAKRLKRGGGAQHISLDFGAAEAELDR